MPSIARVRPGADRIHPRAGTALAPLPKVPSRRRPSMSEMFLSVTNMETIVKDDCHDECDSGARAAGRIANAATALAKSGRCNRPSRKQPLRV